MFILTKYIKNTTSFCQKDFFSDMSLQNFTNSLTASFRQKGDGKVYDFSLIFIVLDQ
jgi:hypothetical protein